MMCMYTETFHVSVIASNATTVVCGILFGGMHPVIFISIEMFQVSVIASNATKVVYGILFGGMHPVWSESGFVTVVNNIIKSSR